MKKIRKFLALILTMALTVACLPLAVGAVSGAQEPLRFNKDGKFKILVATDIHEDEKDDAKSADAMALLTNAIEELKPDLVVFNGDNATADGLENQRATIQKIVAPVAAKNIPLAVVFGNHDLEYSGVSKEEQVKIYQEYANCRMVAGPEDISGCGNYNLLIQNSAGTKDIFNLWFLDSGDYAEEGGYAYVQTDQIKWYEQTSNALKAQNGGAAMPSILFQHITVPEAYDLLEPVLLPGKGRVRGHDVYSNRFWKIKDPSNTTGTLSEGPCPPNINNGQFASWVKQGDILGAVFGHDHVNDFTGTVEGVRLIHTRAVGFKTYLNGVSQGVRLITLDENNLKNFTTEMYDFADLVGKSQSIKGFDRVSKEMWWDFGYGVLGVAAAITAYVLYRVFGK